MGFLAQMLTSVSIQGLATYVVPLNHEFGWSSAATAAGRSVQQVNAFFGPMSGWLVDKFGPRRIMSLGVVLFSLSFFLFSQIDSLVTYYLACFLMAFANQFAGLLAVSVAMNNWFRRKRSTAMGLAVVGLGAAGVTFLPALVWVQGAVGWRASAIWTAIGMLLVGLPIVLLMRDRPEPFGLRQDGDPPSEEAFAAGAQARGGGLTDFTLAEAMRTGTFWLVSAGLALSMLAQSAMFVWQFPYVEGLLNRETAALTLTVVNVFSICGRLVGGWLGDHMPKKDLMGLNLVGTSVAMLLLAFAGSIPMLLAFSVCYGFSWGVRTPVTQALQGDYYGRQAFGKISGITQTIAAPFPPSSNRSKPL